MLVIYSIVGVRVADGPIWPPFLLGAIVAGIVFFQVVGDYLAKAADAPGSLRRAMVQGARVVVAIIVGLVILLGSAAWIMS